MEKNKENRRKILKLGLLAGAAALAGNTLGEAFSQSNKKVRLISADGQIMEVDASNLPSSPSKIASNAELQGWLEEHKSKFESSTINHLSNEDSARQD